MPTVHNSRKKHSSSSSFLPRSTTSTTTIKSSLFPLVFVCILLFVLILSLAVFPSSNNNSLETNVVRVAKDPPQQHSWKLAVQKKREQVAQALQHLTAGKMPSRLRSLRDHHQIVGERLVEVKQGKETVQEILHGHTLEHHDNDLPPMELDEVIKYLDNWIHSLHEALLEVKHGTFETIWQAYHDLTVKTLYPWDQDYLRRMPKRRDDGSIFLSIASYRDENTFNTIYNAYDKAKHPEKLYVGLVQQNCHKNCRSGIMKNLTVVDVPPDDDAYQLFCDTPLGKPICDNKQIRVLNIDEPESLGPYAARFFTSKLWYGEPWFMQIDAHMTFATHWDQESIDMLNKAPSEKPVLSHYPPAHTVDLDAKKDRPGARLCGPAFATSDIEAQIIRLEGAGSDPKQLEYPAFAPFTAAGYFVAHSYFLKEVPFDPFLPWIFMGEEIIMSSRLWTSGYDIFSPTRSVVGHMYRRMQKPKFWESVHRAFTHGIHNPLQMLVLDRVKHQLGYAESSKDFLKHKSILTAVEQYGMGNERRLEDYLNMIGVDMTSKFVWNTEWCEHGFPPPIHKEYYNLYPKGRELLKKESALQTDRAGP